MPQQSHTTLNSTDNASAFASFFEQKALKIAHALYLITSYLPSEEPIRNALRNGALKMIGAMRESGILSSGNGVGAVSLTPHLRELLSYLTIAKSAGYISEMNETILSGEIKTLLESITENEHLDESGTRIADGFFDVPQAVRRLPERVPVAEMQAPQKQSSIQKDTNGTNGDKGRKEKKSKLTRRDKILSLFNDKTTITINDVEKIIEGCSKKTMQRELLSLVEEGVLLKEGEKRWSEYTLAPMHAAERSL